VKRFGAVDYGRRRIGLAVADPLGLTVRGLDTLHYDGDREAAARTVAERLQAEQVGTLLVGLPLHTSGEESEMSREVRRFGALLETAIGLAVEYVDEGLTSWEAEETLKERGHRLKDARRRGDVDKAAACALLRGWLRGRPGGL
jgi:putative Holliday junction resolvase